MADRLRLPVKETGHEPVLPVETVKVRYEVVVVATPLQLLERTAVIGNAPMSIGVPETVLLTWLNNKPAGNVDVPILKEMVDVAVEVAVN